jgi:hypothetical protein
VFDAALGRMPASMFPSTATSAVYTYAGTVKG